LLVLGIPRERILVEQSTHRERGILEADRAAEAQRALAPGDIRLSYAAVDAVFGLPFRGRSLSGRLAHPRHGGYVAAISDAGGGLRRTVTATRKWISLAAYCLTGRSSALSASD
jgi:hypothetical protein